MRFGKNNESKNLLILGAGAWGTALALVAADTQDRVYVWEHDSKQVQVLNQSRENKAYLPEVYLSDPIEFSSEVLDFLTEAQDILVVVPSSFVGQVLEKIQPHCKKDIGIIMASKGFDAERQCFFHETASRIFGSTMEFGVLSGPSFAMEVAKKLPTAVTFASESSILTQRVLSRFSTPYFRIYHTTDVLGVELGGFCKNVIAIAAGISQGLNLGRNARSALITRGLAEMSRLGQRLGAKRETLTGLSGVGDLILTCTDSQSRNQRFGVKIGEGQSAKEALKQLGCLVEGFHNVESLLQLASSLKVELPIAQEVYEILYENKSAKDALQTLLSRDRKYESD